MTTTREEFEAWAKDRGHYLKRRADGVYMDSSACKAWDAWQAAHLAGQRAMQERAAPGNVYPCRDAREKEISRIRAWRNLSDAIDRYRVPPNVTIEAIQQAAALLGLEVKPS